MALSSNKFPQQGKRGASWPRKGEIWLVDYTPNFNKDFEIASKVKKLRPSLILSNDIQNVNSDDILVAPITSIEVNNIEVTEVFIKSSKENGLDKDSKALLHIIRTIDKNFRLKAFLGKISKQELNNAENAIRLIFEV
jgi:mRNA interferase MazF